MRIGRAVIVPAALVLGIAGASITGTAAMAAPAASAATASHSAAVAVAKTAGPNDCGEIARMATTPATLPWTYCHS
jgi:hypothetical protein